MCNATAACEEIIRGVFKEYAHSTAWSISYKGYDLPPKAVISLGYRYSTGLTLPVQGEESFSGGQLSNDFLQKHGFEIVNRASDRTLKGGGKVAL